MLLRGQWVEIDRPRLDRAMRRFKEVQDLAEQEGLTFAEAMRLLAGAAATGDDEPAALPTGRTSRPARGWPKR